MVTYDIAKSSHFTKADGENTFSTWCKLVGIDPDQYPFTVNTFRYSRKGSAIIYRIVSWGCYMNLDRQWVIFLSYRAAANNASIQYNWFADDKGRVIGDPKKNEFVG